MEHVRRRLGLWMTYMESLLASTLDGLHPRAQDEPNPLPISSLRVKDLVGLNGDKIGEESRLEGQLSELCACQTTAKLPCVLA